MNNLREVPLAMASPGEKLRIISFRRGKEFQEKLISMGLNIGDVITIDANPLVRYRLVTAVAVAAGRASPQTRPEDDTNRIEAVPQPQTAARRSVLIQLST